MSVKDKETREIESTYSTTITYLCPKRGKITEIVKVVKYRAQKVPENKPVDSLLSELIGSEIFNDLEEAGFHEVVD
jgi:hypothetical protein